ncbi:MAG: rhodanese-like domain-containing protein [Gammaproteobacteria bacterium]|nr:rhodanese-like domain-containing protein [Gammaproteobacteria bacterium]MDE2345975.1 rhodanese-like domain-containing protein [Gammaproteobacteria bacterium]
MPRLLEFSGHHPFLIAAAVLIILLFLADESLRRLRKYREVAPAQGVLLINKGAAVVDIRTPKEYSEGHVIGARNIPAADLAARISELDKHRGQPVLVYCDSGNSSQKAASTLAKHGFESVHSLKGGIRSWRNEQFPVERG